MPRQKQIRDLRPRYVFGNWQKDWKLELTRQFNWTPGDFRLSLSWRGMMDGLDQLGTEQQRAHNQPAPLPRLSICGHHIKEKVHQMMAAQHRGHTNARSYPCQHDADQVLFRSTFSNPQSLDPMTRSPLLTTGHIRSC